MSIIDDIAFLKIHNEWRRGADIPQASPASIGRAIDSVCQAAMRYEVLRLLNLCQLADVYVRNLHGENFDAIVDELVKARAEV